jgi:hypothetical protein
MPIDGLMPIMPQFTSGSGVDVANGCRLPGGWKESDVPVVFPALALCSVAGFHFSVGVPLVICSYQRR